MQHQVDYAVNEDRTLIKVVCSQTGFLTLSQARCHEVRSGRVAVTLSA